MTKNKQKIRVATTQYALQKFSDWSAYVAHYTEMVKRIKTQEVDLLLLPEYAGLELVDMTQLPTKVFTDIQRFITDYISLFQELATTYNIYLAPGTIPVADDDGKFFNRAYFFTPQGNYFSQDKIMLTLNEIDTKILQTGNEIKTFATSFGRVGIAICYDSEFPDIVHGMTAAGAEVILVPSCTDTNAGYYRVHLSCRARALENQCYVVNSYLVGQAPWCGEMAEHVGAAGIFTPVDKGFPDDGILMLGDMNETQVVVSEIDLEKIAFVRENGAVRNFHDMLSGSRKHFLGLETD